MRSAALLSLTLLGVAGCLQDDPNADTGGWSVQIAQAGTPTFTPLADGDPLTVVLGPQGADMVLVDLRVAVPPGGSHPGNVTLRASSLIGDVVVGGWKQTGGDWVAAPAGSDGRSAWMLKDFRVVFSADPCCFMCSTDGTVTLSVGLAAPLRRKVLFTRTGCPDSVACCWKSGTCPLANPQQCKSVDTCPNPSTAALCSASPMPDGGGAADLR